jgi:YgiT-type zinc finger domain-containing protein
VKPFEKCPICGHELIEKNVEKLLRGGIHTAIVRVQAEVCLHCGERLYSQDVISRFEQIRRQLDQQETDQFEQLGHSFRAAM